jgi:hypothetical protein
MRIQSKQPCKSHKTVEVNTLVSLELIYTILKAQVSTVVVRHFFTNNPSQLFQINLMHVYRC